MAILFFINSFELLNFYDNGNFVSQFIELPLSNYEKAIYSDINEFKQYGTIT